MRGVLCWLYGGGSRVLGDNIITAGLWVTKREAAWGFDSSFLVLQLTGVAGASPSEGTVVAKEEKSVTNYAGYPHPQISPAKLMNPFILLLLLPSSTSRLPILAPHPPNSFHLSYSLTCIGR